MRLNEWTPWECNGMCYFPYFLELDKWTLVPSKTSFNNQHRINRNWQMRVASNQIVAGDYDYIGQKTNENNNQPMTTTTNLRFTPNDWFFCIFILRCCVFSFPFFLFIDIVSLTRCVVFFSLACQYKTFRCVFNILVRSCQNCVLLVTKNKSRRNEKTKRQRDVEVNGFFFFFFLLLVSFDCWLLKCLSHDTYFKRHMSSEAALQHYLHLFRLACLTAKCFRISHDLQLRSIDGVTWLNS